MSLILRGTFEKAVMLSKGNSPAQMLVPSAVYGQMGEEVENEDNEYKHSPILVLRFKMLHPRSRCGFEIA